MLGKKRGDMDVRGAKMHTQSADTGFPNRLGNATAVLQRSKQVGDDPPSRLCGLD